VSGSAHMGRVDVCVGVWQHVSTAVRWRAELVPRLYRWKWKYGKAIAAFMLGITVIAFQFALFGLLARWLAKRQSRILYR